MMAFDRHSKNYRAFTEGAGTRSFTSLTLHFFRAIVAHHAGSPQERCHGHVFDNNKHMHSHIKATIGRAGSVTNQQ